MGGLSRLTILWSTSSSQLDVTLDIRKFPFSARRESLFCILLTVVLDNHLEKCGCAGEDGILLSPEMIGTQLVENGKFVCPYFSYFQSK